MNNRSANDDYRCCVVTLPAVRRAVADGRAWSRDTLKEWQLDDMTDVVQQIVSELVTNSVEHADTSDVRVLLLHATGTLRLDVTDDDVVSLPVIASASVEDISGRGLMIVDALSDRWGVRITARAKTVWSELTPESAQCWLPGGHPPNGLALRGIPGGRGAVSPGLTSAARREGGALKRPDTRGVPGGRPPGLAGRPDTRGVPGGRPPGSAPWRG